MYEEKIVFNPYGQTFYDFSLGAYRKDWDAREQVSGEILSVESSSQIVENLHQLIGSFQRSIDERIIPHFSQQTRGRQFIVDVGRTRTFNKWLIDTPISYKDKDSKLEGVYFFLGAKDVRAIMNELLTPNESYYDNGTLHHRQKEFPSRVRMVLREYEKRLFFSKAKGIELIIEFPKNKSGEVFAEQQARLRFI
jgi:hypothetical protein